MIERIGLQGRLAQAAFETASRTPAAGACPGGEGAPHRAETRATLIAAIACGRRWLAELLDDRNISAERIATRERCTVRKVQMTISLAFLSPDLVKATIKGRLPRGIGVARLAGMPAQWSRQHQMLGLTT
jgi:site-specific DNA recombinase